MPRVMWAGVSGILVGLLIGGYLMIKIGSFSFSKENLAVVDLFVLIEHQRLHALKEAKNPDEIDEMIRNRLVRLANVLAELGEKQLILNKTAVVSGTLPDLTAQVEEQLSQGRGGPR